MNILSLNRMHEIVTGRRTVIIARPMLQRAGEKAKYVLGGGSD